MNKPSKDLLLTFDYELFLGSKSGSVDDCLIKPTQKILTLLNSFNAKAIFFVDTTYLVRLNEIRLQYKQANHDWLQIIEQIRQMAREGHEVFPHLHPHWLDALYRAEINEWDLSDNSRYRFHVLKSNERDAIWESSMRLLHEVIDPLGNGHRLDGYRAGGWCIQPFADFRPYFERYGIRAEFSVMPGYKQVTTAHQFDFLQAPAIPVYHFDEDPVIEKKQGCYTQYTISSIGKIKGIDRFLNRVLHRLVPGKMKQASGRGLTVQAKALDPNAEYWVTNEAGEMVSIEHLTLAKLRSYRKSLRQQAYMHFLSHPKLITDHHLYCFRVFLQSAFHRYNINTDFRKIGS